MAAQSSAPFPDIKLEVETSSQEIVVHCSGKITLSTTATFQDQVRPLISQTKRIILDLAQVNYVDSAGLGEIVRLWSSAQKAGGALKITNLAPRIKELLAMTNLATIFEA
jgi:anti-sigma B factor antagonist